MTIRMQDREANMIKCTKCGSNCLSVIILEGARAKIMRN